MGSVSSAVAAESVPKDTTWVVVRVLPPSTVTQAATSSSPPGAVGNRPCTAHAIAPMRINTDKDGG